MKPNQNDQNIQIKMSDDIVGGVYANNMVVGHNREEFVMDFIYMAPPQGKVNARVIVSPGHMKRIIHALKENMRKFENEYGPLPEMPEIKENMLVQ